MLKLYKLNSSLYKVWLKNAFKLLLFVISIQTAKAQTTCQAGFTYTIANNEVSFTNTSTNSANNPMKYFWNFGDYQLNYDGVDVKHKYHSSGNYVVTLNAYDTVSNCHSVFKDTVNFNYVYTHFCKAEFGSYKNEYLREVVFYSLKTSNYQTYYWDFGDSTTSNINDTSRYASKKHIYKNWGTYNVCMVLRDSFHACFDTVCNQITITRPDDLDSCKAKFGYNHDHNGKVYFYPSASCGQWKPTSYFWDFGNGDTSNLMNPSYTYKTGGPHIVKLIVKGTGSAIADTIVQNVYLGGICQADYKLITYSNDLERGVKISLLPSTKFEINFGDGTKISTLNGKDSVIKHAYTNGGIYTICYTRTDTVFNCSDTVCFDVKIKNPQWCRSTFRAWPIEYSRLVSVSVDSTSAGKFSSFYEWDFGDGTKDTGTGKFQTTHKYFKDSTYKITLTVRNYQYSCTTSSSNNVTILYKQKPCEITGKVYIDATNLADSAIVYLIQVDDSVNHTLTLVDTAIVVNDTLGNRTYRFTNIATGKYMIKAVLARNSQYYQIFFPTYYYTTLKWSNADAIYMVNGYSDNKTANIYLKIGKNPGGPGFIGGKISAGANKKEGDPLEDIQVMLFNANKEPVTYTYSDADGNFKFENIAYGTYEVYTEVIGLKTNSAFVTISEEKPKVENVVVKVSESGISTSIRSNLNEDFIAQPKLYPNPTQNILYLETQLRKSQNTRLVIYNITGQEVYNQNISMQQGNQTHTIDTGKLPAGLYMLCLKNALGTDELRYKFVKSH